MFVLEGKLINIFETPKGKTRDGQDYGGEDRIQVMHEITLDGQDYGGEDRIQVMHEITLKNGEKRIDLVDLTVDDVSPYRDKLNAPVRVPVLISVYQNKVSVKAAA